jgi:DNA repair protein RadA/Sms
VSKTKLKYICSSCGYESLKWIGKCPECDNWNSFVEEFIETGKKKHRFSKSNVLINRISEITVTEDDRIKTNIEEFDRVLGGGLMPGSVVLLGGDPGIGKSTLAMQACANLQTPVLYVSGEESSKQIKLRAERLKITSADFYVMPETDLRTILDTIEKISPSIVVIDSIQTVALSELDNSPGTMTQIKECTAALMEEAKKKHFCVIVIGHVTKEGLIAGPKVLEHIVDTVIQFEGEHHHSFRILRAQKNRFGSTNEIGVFEMHEDGLIEVKNPSKLLLSERERKTSGSVVTSSIEGTRPILLEVQALVTPSNFGNPQRVATGFDYRRLAILLAVIEKRAGFRLSANNVFLNMAGGIRITEPAIDLAVCCSIASSLLDKVIDSETVIVGEVGLGGEVRSVGHIDKRIQEAEKLGFKSILIPSYNHKTIKNTAINIVPVENLVSAINKLMPQD